MAQTARRRLLTGFSILAIADAALYRAASAADTQPATAPPARQVLAANSPAPGHVAVEEVVVTAQKRSENINKVGLSITALGRQTLKEQNIQSVADVAKAVPGLSFTNSANNTPIYTLRGVGFYDTSLGSYPTTSVYIDQVPLPFPVLTDLSAFDLTQIEVLKGPQGTLFGQNSTGGAINYIANKPTATPAAGIDFGYGRFNTFIGDGYMSGPITPDLDGRLALRVQEGGPWQHSYTRDASNGSTDQVAGRMTLDWHPSDILKFELSGNVSRDSSQPEAVQYIAFNHQAISNTPPVLAYPTAPADPQAADWSTDNGMYLNRRQAQISLRGDVSLTPDITMTSITSYINFDEAGALDQDGINLSDIDLRYFTGAINSVYQEIRFANSQTDRFRWIVGGNYSHDHVYYNENLNYANSSAFFNDGIDTSDNYSDQTMNNYAAFASGEFDITNQLKVLGGVRFTQADRSAEICNHDGGDGKTAAFFTYLSSLLTGVAQKPLTNTDCFALKPNFMAEYTPYQGQLNQNNVSWRGGLNYTPIKNTLLYVNISKGYKAGEYGNINAATQSQYAPAVQESILEYEAGVKAELLENRLSFNAAGFYMDYNDKQLRSKVVDPVFGIIDEIINIPKSHIDGFEVDATAIPIYDLTLGGAITLIDSEIDKYVGVNAGGVAANFAGTSVPFTPKLQAGLNGRYEHAFTDTLTGYIGAQLTYRSRTNAIVGGSPDYNIDAWTTVDAQLGIESTKGWKLSLWGKNLTNKYYWTNVVAGQDTIVRYAAYPVTYGFTLGYTF